MLRIDSNLIWIIVNLHGVMTGGLGIADAGQQIGDGICNLHGFVPP